MAAEPETSHPLFERLLERYQSPVLFFFRNRGFSFQDSLDLTQDTFVRVFTNIDRLRSEEAAGSWVKTIATNVWKNRLRHLSAQKRAAQETSLETLMEETTEPRPAEELPVGGSRPGNPLTETLGREQLDRTREAIRRLPPKQQRCLRLSITQGLKYPEIAALLGISVQTVKSHIHQGRKRLKELLEREIGGAEREAEEEP